MEHWLRAKLIEILRTKKLSKSDIIRLIENDKSYQEKQIIRLREIVSQVLVKNQLLCISRVNDALGKKFVQLSLYLLDYFN